MKIPSLFVVVFFHHLYNLTRTDRFFRHIITKTVLSKPFARWGIIVFGKALADIRHLQQGPGPISAYTQVGNPGFYPGYALVEVGTQPGIIEPVDLCPGAYSQGTQDGKPCM